ncbi:cold-shock protein [Candidatus Phytoplasma sacchari]|nr:cold shock domain-containing protein [Candidatus Phytoplasma sacchari]KAB8122715.1 cold shock domain-containing protein [Candidatus Phytoplasma sacchari]
MTKFRGTVKWFDPSKGYGFIMSVKEVDETKQITNIPDVILKDSDNDAVNKWTDELKKNPNAQDIFCHHSSIIREGDSSATDLSQRSSFHNSENEQRGFHNIKRLKQNEQVEFVICWSDRTVDNQKQPQAIDIIVLTQEEIKR